ncbi:MAG: hypothetical protein ACRCSV_00590 [Chlamydiales bacterium]
MLVGSLGYSSEINLQEGKEYISKFYIKEIIQEVGTATRTENKDGQVHTTIDSTTEITEKVTPELIQSRIDSLLKTYEGSLLYVGWDNGEKCDYDISVLTKGERARAIESGIAILSEIALSEETDLICSETLAGYFYEKQEYKKAIYWAFYGAENGSAVCMTLLSDSHIRGIGVVQNFEEGLKWTYLAAAKGDKISQKWVKKYGIKAVTDKDLAPILNDAKLRANKWMLDHSDIFISID